MRALNQAPDHSQTAHRVAKSRTGGRVVARAFPEPAASWTASNAPRRFRMLGVRIDNLTMTDAIGRIIDAALGRVPRSFAFVNADCLNIACENPTYANLLGQQHDVFADGSGVALAARLRGIAVRENVNGTDMFPLLCEEAAKQGLSIFLLGGRPGVADGAARNMADEYPDLSIAGAHHGYFDATQEQEIIAMINRSGADILLVGLGAPRQESWIAANRDKLNAKVTMGVGGLYDYYSGRVWRAPIAMRRTGMEWVWRMAQEPQRLWRRYVLGNPKFLARCIGEQVMMMFGHGEALANLHHLELSGIDVTGPGAAS